MGGIFLPFSHFAGMTHDYAARKRQRRASVAGILILSYLMHLMQEKTRDRNNVLLVALKR